VFAAAHTLVATLDVAVPVAVQAIGGIPGFNYYPVIIEGDEARICLPNHALADRTTYSVTVDAGAFREGAEACAAVGQANSWTFSTRPAGPAADAPLLTVAADGSGDFCTVQGALDWIPTGNRAARTIVLRRGTYAEIVAFAGKHNLTLRGEDRQGSVIAYPNNARFNPSANLYANGAAPVAGDPHRRSVYHRGVFLAKGADRLTLTHLTLRNTTPQGGSQAEALILDGTLHARAEVRDVDLFSYQDTLQINGQAYVAGCRVTGDVDFLWGTGPCFFEACTFVALRTGAYYTQIRNPASNHGYVFHRCRFEGAPGVTDNYLARIEPNRFPHSEVVLLDCILGPSVGAVGWQLQGNAAIKRAPWPDLHFWESGSRDPQGKPIATASRLPLSRQLTRPGDAALIADYAKPAFVLGDGWSP
jgi:pectin methylesterase-like acyl-CoA thioesterase